MASLLAIYRSPIEQVLQQWNEAAQGMGFETVEPITKASDGWECLRLSGEKIYVSIHRSYKLPDGEDSVWVHLWGGGLDEFAEILPMVLELPLKASEVIVVFDKDLVNGFATYEVDIVSPEKLIESYESEYLTDALHSLRAFHRDLLTDPEIWRAEAKERGLGWQESGEYGVLSVHWEERRQAWPSRDHLTGLPTEEAIFQHLPPDHFSAQFEEEEEEEEEEPPPQAVPCGTLFVIKISEALPNPQRAHEPWREVSIRTARILEKLATGSLVLGRFYSTRRMALVCPGLAKQYSVPMLETIRYELSQGFADSTHYAKGQIYTASWPDDGETMSPIFDLVCELEERAEGAPFAGR